MFALFETLLRPTDPPEHPEPPAGLLAFFWHFARQAKWLFVALFVIEMLRALTDSAVPWFMGRIVTLVTTVAPDRFLAVTWPMLAGMGLVVLVARPCVALARYLIINQAIAAPFTGLIRWQAHWHVVRQSWAFFQNDFAGRISNRVMQTGPAVRSTLTASVTALWYILVYGADRDRHDGLGRPLADGADPGVVRRLCRAAHLFRAAHARALQGELGGALGPDGAHRRQLHQHPHRQAVRARRTTRTSISATPSSATPDGFSPPSG